MRRCRRRMRRCSRLSATNRIQPQCGAPCVRARRRCRGEVRSRWRRARSAVQSLSCHSCIAARGRVPRGVLVLARRGRRPMGMPRKRGCRTRREGRTRRVRWRIPLVRWCGESRARGGAGGGTRWSVAIGGSEVGGGWRACWFAVAVAVRVDDFLDVVPLVYVDDARWGVDLEAEVASLPSVMGKWCFSFSMMRALRLVEPTTRRFST